MRERCMMKRFHVILASSSVGVFCLLFIVSITFSPLNSQIASIALSLIELLGVVGIIGAIAFLAGRRSPDTTYGNAHFATPQEIQHSGFVAEQESLVVGESKRLLVGIPPHKQHEHVLLVATTGAGKSTGIIIPAILSETGRRGVFVNDMKGELYQKTAGALSRHLPVSLFSPMRPQASGHYNPLAHIQSQADAELDRGIMSAMATRFLIMKNPTLRTIRSTPPDPQRNIDFQRLAHTPEALFLSIPASDTRRLRPVTSLLIMQLMNSLAKRQNGKPFVLYMDELANIGKIPHYAEHISLVRDQGIALIQAIQNFSQLHATYDREDAQTIIANSTTKIFYPGMGKPECEYASQLLGTTTVALKSRTISPDRSETSSQSVTKRPLLNPEEIRQLPRGNLIVVSGNLPPMLVRNTPYYEQETLLELADRALQELPAPPTSLIDPGSNVCPTPSFFSYINRTSAPFRPLHASLNSDAAHYP